MLARTQFRFSFLFSSRSPRLRRKTNECVRTLWPMRPPNENFYLLKNELWLWLLLFTRDVSHTGMMSGVFVARVCICLAILSAAIATAYKFVTISEDIKWNNAYRIAGTDDCGVWTVDYTCERVRVPVCCAYTHSRCHIYTEYNINDSILFHSNIRHQSNWSSDGAIFIILLSFSSYSVLKCDKLGDSYAGSTLRWRPHIAMNVRWNLLFAHMNETNRCDDANAKYKHRAQCTTAAAAVASSGGWLLSMEP